MKFRKIISALLTVSMLATSASFNTFAEGSIDLGTLDENVAVEEPTTEESAVEEPTAEEPAVEELFIEETVMADYSQAVQFVYEYDGKPLPIPVEKSPHTVYDACVTLSVTAAMPGIKYDETTVSELMQLYSGVDFTSVVLTSCSDSNIDINDFYVSVFVQTGSSRTDYESYLSIDSNVVEFSTLDLNEDWIVHGIGFRIMMTESDRVKNGLKEGDLVYVNPDANTRPFYDFEVPSKKILTLNKVSEKMYETEMILSGSELGFETYGDFIDNYSGIKTINKNKVGISVDNADNNTFDTAFTLSMHSKNGVYFWYYSWAYMNLAGVDSFDNGNDVVSGDAMRDLIIDRVCVNFRVTTSDDLADTVYLFGSDVTWYAPANETLFCRPYAGADSYILVLDGKEYSYDTVNNGLPVKKLVEAEDKCEFTFELYAVVGNDRIDLTTGYLYYKEKEKWIANYKYNSETDTLTWDNYPFAMPSAPKPWEVYGYYDVYFGDVPVYYYAWSFISDDGTPTKPVINPLLEMTALNVFNGNNIPGDATIKAYGGVMSEDSFTLPDGLGEYDPDIDEPVIEKFTRTLDSSGNKVDSFKIKFDKTDDILGYILYYNAGFNSGISITNSDQCSIYVSNASLDTSCKVRICAVDKNGNYGPEVTAELNPGMNNTWTANYVYDPTTDKLSWDNYAFDEKANPATGDTYGDYNVVINGIYSCYAWSSYENNGSVSRPCINPILELAKFAAVEGADLTGDVTIRACALVGYGNPSDDEYIFNFKGGSLNENLAPPTINNVERVETVNTDILARVEKDADVFGYIFATKCGSYTSNGISTGNDIWMWHVEDGKKVTSPVEVTIYAVDKDGNYSLPTKITYEPEDDNGLADGEWLANYSYDADTDRLTWDNYPFEISGTPAPWTPYGYYDVNFDDVTAYFYAWSFITDDGTPTKPVINPLLKITAFNVFEERNISAGTKIRAVGNGVESKDVFTLSNREGKYNSKIATPVIKEFTRTENDSNITFNVNVNKPDNVLGHIVRFKSSNGTSISTTTNGNCTYVIYGNEGSNADPIEDCEVTVYAVDKNGDYSLPVTATYSSYVTNDTWIANYVYDPASDELTWDNCEFEGIADPEPWDVYGEYSVRIGAIDEYFYASSQYDEDGNITRPKIYPTLWLTNRSVIFGDDVTGDVTIRASVMNGDASADEYVFSYNGGSLNENLASPVLAEIKRSDPALFVYLENDADTLGYVYSYKYGNSSGNGVSWNGYVYLWYVDYEITKPVELTIYAVDKNGNYSLPTVITYDPAETVEKDGNTFTYIENPDGTLKITGGTITNPDVVIPGKINGKTVTEIDNYAFMYNSTIKTLTFEEGVKRLCWYAFNTCDKLESVTLPSSLEYIDSWAFERCYSLTEITVPENVSVIKGGAFAQNKTMTAINVDENNKYYTSVNGILFSKDKKVLVSYPAGKSGAYTVPDSVDHIEDAAFYGARQLTEINISGTLDYIGFEAFAECESLKSITINEGVTYVGYWAFRNCNGIKNIYVPTSVENIGDRAFGFADRGDKLIPGFTLEGYVDSSIYFYAKRHGIPFKSRGVDYSIESPYVEENKTTTEIEASSTATEKEKEEQITQISATAPINLMAKNESGKVLASGDDIKIKGKNIENAATVNSIKAALEIKDDKPVSLIDIELWAGNEDISDKFDGLVKVDFEIPNAFKKTEVCCHRIVIDENGNVTKELIPGERHGNKYTVYLEHFSTYSLTEDESVSGFTVSGKIKSKGDNARASSDVTIELLDEDGSVKYTTAGADTYSFSNVASGAYTLRVSKSKHCARTYSVTVSGAAVEQDVELQLYGDVDNNGIVTLDDVIDVINYFNKKTSAISSADGDLQDYLIAVSDVDGDGVVKLDDAIEMINYFNKKASAFDRIA